MAISDYITRIFGQRPVWLYRVTVGGVSYHYTSKAGGYTTPANSPSTEFPTGQVWTSKPIVRGEISMTVKANRADTWFRLPTVDALSGAIIAETDVEKIDVEIWRGFIGDPENAFELLFRGRVVEVQPALILSTFVCSTDVSESSRSSVAQVVQRPCRHAHYFTNADGGGCRLNLADWQTTLSASAVMGRTVTVSDAALQADGFYLAGIFEFAGVEYMIESHIGDQILLENVPIGLDDAIVAGLGAADVKLAPGCNLTIENCSAFNNLENFGGFNDMLDSPFDGRSIA